MPVGRVHTQLEPYRGEALIGTREQREHVCTERSQDGKCLLVLSAESTGTCCTTILDERDTRIALERIERFGRLKGPGPRVGDFVIFADDVVRRVSHVWEVSDGWETDTYQTSDISGGGYAHGRWYLGDGFCEFSGGLHTSIPGETLTDTGELRDGTAWFFHHDRKVAHNGVEFRAPFRVFTCSLATS